MKTRFAPSPTGYMHIGNLRTLLYAYLITKSKNGKFLLRIEDTDRERYVEDAVKIIIETIKFFDINIDEGVIDIDEKNNIIETGVQKPYIQSQRLEIYQKYAQKLIDKGNAYRCFCTKERLDEMREIQKKQGLVPKYDERCRHLKDKEINEKLKNNAKYVIRMKIPKNVIIEYDDIVYGKLKFNTNSIDDQVLIKSDGFPTYVFAVVIDDHLMNITHINRGFEFISTTPKNILLYNWFGWKLPIFCHLPGILNTNGKKLGKRDGAVSVQDFVNMGYLKEAIINFIAFLGWNPGTEKEIFSLSELEKEFDMKKIHKAGAIFDMKKLDYLNGYYIRNMNIDKLVQRSKNFVSKKFWICNEKYKNIIQIERDRLKTLVEIEDKIKNYYETPDVDIALVVNEKMKVNKQIALKSLENLKINLEKIDKWTIDNIKQECMNVITNLGYKNGQVLWPLRSAITGLEFSPGAFEVSFVIGKKECIKRIDNILNKF